MEAGDERVPLYERIKFLAIYSSNLEEFFRVRLGAVKQMLAFPKLREKGNHLLASISLTVDEQQTEFGKIYREQIIPELNRENIYITSEEKYTPKQAEFASEFFAEEVMYQLQPVLLVKNKVVPFLQNGAIYLVVCLFSGNLKKGQKQRVRYAMLKIPSDTLPRFVELPATKGQYHITFLDDIIRDNLNKIFRGYEIGPAYSVKISRDADFELNEEAGDLLEKMKKGLKKRKIGDTARFLYDESMPPGVLDFLKSCFNLKKNEMIAGARYHNFFDFFRFPNPKSPDLELHPPAPMRVSEFDRFVSGFEAVKARDWLFHYPYQSYDYFLRFLNEAAFDPKVFEIKATQYRVAADSAIVNALINAARNGKSVTVFVEIKARFDEESNLRFAQQMQNAGVKIIYSLPGLKVHAKACLISRKSGNKKGVRQYAFLSTGNFNEKTARVYSDMGFFTSNPHYTLELSNLFHHLEAPENKYKFKHLWVGQFNLIPEIQKHIQQEIDNAKAGIPAKILIKLNNLEDPAMIDWLYDASEAGVKIEIIVRGICCLIPGKKYSKNIQVRRIVDMYLEHSRVFVFHNGGLPKIYLSSADWMRRNLYHRIELAFPIEDLFLKQEILDILDFQLNDTLKAHYINDKLENVPIEQNKPALRAQTAIYTYLREKHEIGHEE